MKLLIEKHITKGKMILKNGSYKKQIMNQMPGLIASWYASFCEYGDEPSRSLKEISLLKEETAPLKSKLVSKPVYIHI
jgi:hypothetical protein